MSQPIRTSLATNIKSRSASTAKDARIVNGYVETIEDKKYVVKRPGLSKFTPSSGVLPSGSGGGIYNFNGALVNITNSNIYKTNFTTSVSTVTFGIPTSYSSFNLPQTFQFNNNETVMYVLQQGTNSVSVVNTITGAIVTSIAVGNTPIASCISLDGSTLYVANYNSGTVSVINTATNIVTGTLVVGQWPSGLTLSKDGTKVYVCCQYNVVTQPVYVINTATNTLGANLFTPAFPVSDVAVTSDGATAVFVSGSTGSLIFYNLVTPGVITTFNNVFTMGSGKPTPVIDSSGNVYICDTSKLYKYSKLSGTWTFIGSVTLPVGNGAYSIDTVNNIIFVTNNANIYPVDLLTFSALSSSSIPITPYFSIVSKYNNALYLVTNSGSTGIIGKYQYTTSVSSTSAISLIGVVQPGPYFFNQTSQKPYLFFSNSLNSYVLNGATSTLVTIDNTKVAKLTLNSGGSGYTPGIGYSLTFSGGGGSGAAGTFDVNSAGTVTNVTLTNGGSNYTSAPTVSFPGSSTGVPALFAGIISGATLSVYELYDGVISIGQKVTGMGTVAGNEPIITGVISTGAPGSNAHSWGGGVGSAGITPTVYSLDRAIPTPAAYEVFNVGGVFTGSVTGNTLTVTAVGSGVVFGTGEPYLFDAAGGFIGTFASNGTGVGGVGTYFLQAPVATNVPAGTKMVCAASPASAMTTANQAGATCAAMLNSFPTTQLAVGAVYLDDTIYVMDITGRIYNSGIEDPTTWGALDYITKTSEPDGGIAITKHMNWLVAFGKWSMEFFYNAGNSTGSPLNRNDTAKQEVGCANGWSVCSFMDTVVWIGQTRESGRGVYLLNGQVPQKISSEAIERFLNADQLTNVRAYPISLAGHYLYVLQLKDTGYTFVYDISEKLWYQWSSNVYGTESIFEYMFGASVNGVQYLQNESVGTTCKLLTTNYQDTNDDGTVATINCRVVTNLLDGGTNARKFFSSLEVIGDITTTTIQIRHSDDDYNTWSSYRTVDMSVNRPIIRQLGAARRRAYEFLHTDNTPLRIEGIELNIEGGTF